MFSSFYLHTCLFKSSGLDEQGIEWRRTHLCESQCCRLVIEIDQGHIKEFDQEDVKWYEAQLHEATHYSTHDICLVISDIWYYCLLHVMYSLHCPVINITKMRVQTVEEKYRNMRRKLSQIGHSRFFNFKINTHNLCSIHNLPTKNKMSKI